MKKIMLFAAVIAAFSFASCKKDHTCTCKDSTSTVAYPLGKTTKKKAKEACDVTSALWAIGGGSCSI